VISDIFGVSGRQMLEALIAGQRDPSVLAQKAKGRMRPKITVLHEALRGFFTNHRGVILQMMLENIDRLSAQVAALDTVISQAIAPYAAQVQQLADITGFGTVSAQELIAEIGVDMSRFPSAAHLVSWAKFCPQTHSSAGKTKSKGQIKGNPWLGATLGNIAATSARTNTFLGVRYRRIAKHRGPSKAIVATGNTVLTIVYHLLNDPDARFRDLGPTHIQQRINQHRKTRNLASALQAITGQTIMIRDGKAVIIEPEAA